MALLSFSYLKILFFSIISNLWNNDIFLSFQENRRLPAEPNALRVDILFTESTNKPSDWPELTVYNRFHMIDPNFQRLANRSVIFDKTFAQIAVCNPSRDSMLTGLRPDTVGTYQFQSCFRPHLVMQNQFVKAGYTTAGYGKIAHWDGGDREIWSVEMQELGWYDYQSKERSFMNSSTMPDRVWPEEKFRDHMFATRAVAQLGKFLQNRENKNFMLGIGFKNPHLQIHVPYAYYDMYKNRTDAFKLTKKELRFPHSTPDVAYRCCAEPNFMFMNEEGAARAKDVVSLGDINMAFTDRMREEAMIGYCAAITFVDKQLGKILDVMDAHNGWKDTVVILTADHGMHNGEKGLWEKWSMFDESTRVPLFIYDPRSPFAGQHYEQIVELVDVYPTVTDLLSLPYQHESTCSGYELFHNKKKVCHQLQGKSLAPIILGDKQYRKIVENDPNRVANLKRLLVPRGGEFMSKDGQKLAMSPKYPNPIYKNPKRALHILNQLSDYLPNGNLAVADAATSSTLITNNSIAPDFTLEIDPEQWSKYEYNYYPNPSIHHNAFPEFDQNSTSTEYQQNNANLRHRRILLASNYTVAPGPSGREIMPKLAMNFAISQSWRCAKLQLVKKADAWRKEGGKGTRPRSNWYDCDKTLQPEDEISIMGYSLRTFDYRYTSWFHYNRKLCLPILDSTPFDQELYDHRGERWEDFTHIELVNLVRRPGYEDVISALRTQLLDFIKANMIFRGCFRDGAPDA